jgi:hypothetical protein
MISCVKKLIYASQLIRIVRNLVGKRTKLQHQPANPHYVISYQDVATGELVQWIRQARDKILQRFK